MATKIPRSKEDDYTREMAEARRRFVQEQTGATLTHVGSFSFDPNVLPGNIENFMGVAQVPIGLAGPLRINGELIQMDDQPILTPPVIQRVMYAALTQKQREKFEAELELDISYSVPGKARFRVNIYRQRE